MKRYDTIEDLKVAIKKSWRGLDARFLKKVTARFRSRLERVLGGGGAFLG